MQNKRFIENSLVNVDYKIASKALAETFKIDLFAKQVD